jgi:hypothetical protein
MTMTTVAETVVRRAHDAAERNVMDVQDYIDLFAVHSVINPGQNSYCGDMFWILRRPRVWYPLVRLTESSHESCQTIGIRWAIGVQRCADADDSTRRGLGQDQEYYRQSSGSC